ncbi:MAG: hypothetical protein QF551_08730 [Candidatus Marinimicrobia bacterium]|nr:hypothetical protein [Candidatus Neomarinimicrobiota bacterium]
MKKMSAVLTILFSTILSAQTIAVVSYMKVEPGNTQEYLEVEKIWKKIHQTRLEKGMIKFWGLYSVMYTGTASEYNYVTVNHFNNMNELDNSWSDDLVQESFPGKSEAELNKMMARTSPSRDLIRSEPYNLVSYTETEPAEPTKILFINFMTIEQGTNNAYVTMENEIYKPMHEESVKSGSRTGWSLWSKMDGDMTSGQYVTVDSYSSWDQMDQQSPFADLFKKVHPKKRFNKVSEMTNQARLLERRETWELIDSVY